MKYLLLLTLLFTYTHSKNIVRTTDQSIHFSIDSKSVLAEKNGEHVVENNRPNEPMIHYLSYLFIAPEKIDSKDFNVKLSLGKRVIQKHVFNAGLDMKGNPTSLTKNFEKPFYEISYVKQLSGMSLYKIDIYPFSYNNVQKSIQYNSSMDISINFMNSLSKKYNGTNFPQRETFSKAIINLNRIKFESRKNSISLAKAMDESYELTALSFTQDSLLVDYLVITPAEFVEQAKRLCAFRDSSSFDKVEYPKYITTETIYSVFEAINAASYQPKAKSIQSAIAKLKKNSYSLLTYVVLMGSGYSETWASQVRKNYIPAYTETKPIDVTSIVSYLSSDELYLFKDGVASFPNTTFVGRLPARSIEEVGNLVDKIVAYDDFSLSKGSWKNKILLIADDDMQGDKPDGITTPHENYIENNITKFIPSYVEKQRVYMNLYPLDNSNYKPTATKDMVNTINSGTLFALYSGHGGVTVLSDERLFTVENISSLTNSKYPIFMFLSCDVGAFHGLDASLSDVLVNYKNHGSSMVISTTLETYATPNNIFGGAVVKAVYANDNKSIGEAITLAKLAISSQSSSYREVALAYHLYGDPATVVRLPKSVELNDETPMYPFEKVTTSTTIGSGEWNYEYIFYDALKHVSYITKSHNKLVTYYENGSKLYNNHSTVVSGVVAENFIAPKNIIVNDSTAGYTIYAENKMEEYLFYNLKYRAYPPKNYSGNVINNVDGPRIKFFMVNSVEIGVEKYERVSPLHNSDEIKLPAVVKVEVTDNNGVYLNSNYGTDGGYGGLPYFWDNEKPSYAYTSFNKENESFSIELDSNSFAAGLHKLTVSAVDVQGNISKESITLNVVTPESQKLISRIYTYPNPGKLPIKIAFQLLDNVYEGKVLIYDSRGTLIKSFRIMEEIIREGFNHINWDGTTNNGLKAGVGMYVAQIIVYKDAQDKAAGISQTKRFKFIIE